MRRKLKRERVCPICGRARMIPCGKIRPGGKGRLKTVYRCPKCGYRSL